MSGVLGRVSTNDGLFGVRAERLDSSMEHVGVSGGGIFGGSFGGTRLSAGASGRSAGQSRPIVGLAVPWDTISEPAGRAADGRLKRFRFAPGAFRESLGSIRRGWSKVEFLREHETERLIGSTLTPGFLHFEETGRGLELKIDTATGPGALVASLLRANPLIRLSGGFKPAEYDSVHFADGSVLLDITRAQLFEVSMVRNPAFRDAFLFQR